MNVLIGLAIVAQILLIAASLLWSALSLPASDLAEPIAFGLVTLSFPAVGAVVLTRRPSHPVGRLLSVVAIGWAVANAAGAYARYALTGGSPGAAVWGLWLSGNSWTIVISQGLLLTLLLILPTGALPSPRWRPVIGLIGLWTVLSVLATALADVPLGGLQGVTVPNPAAAPEPVGPLLAGLLDPLALGFVALFVLTTVALVIRFRRSFGTERQQLKVIALSAVGAALMVGTALTALAMVPEEAPGAERFLPFIIVGALSPGLLPVGIGLAVLRYRLYEIDRLVNLTVVYVSLTAVLALIYVGLVLVLTDALRPVTGSTDLAVATSTLAVVILFTPLRRRIQEFVDRRFYRARYDAQQTVAAFSARMRDQVGLGEVVEELEGVVEETFAPSSVEVWLRGRRD